MTNTATHSHQDVSEAMKDLASFPLLAAIYGRRSRRFAMGDVIPDGPLAYESKHEAMPLSDLERLHRAHIDGRVDRLALRHHPQRAVRAALRQLRRAAPAGARSRAPPASTRPSSSSPTTRGRTSSRPAMRARWSTRPTRRSRPS